MARTPSYRKHSTRNKGLAKYQGKVYYFPGKFGSPESRRAYQSWLAEVVCPEPPALPSDGSAAVVAVVAAFLDHAADYYGAHAKSEYHNFVAALAPLADLHGDLSVAELTPARLRELQTRLAKTPGRRGRRKDGSFGQWQRSRGYVNACLRRVRQMLKWGAAHELVPLEVYHHAHTVAPLKPGRSPAAEPPRREPVPLRSVARTLAELNEPVATMVRVQWYTACRPGQVCGMRWEEIDTTADLWTWRPSRHKTAYRGTQITLYLGKRCQQLLADFPKSGHVFTSREAQPYRPSSYRQAIVRAARRAGVPAWTPHQLRHTRLTAIRARYGRDAAQMVAQHASPGQTDDYTRQALSLARQVASEIG